MPQQPTEQATHPSIHKPIVLIGHMGSGKSCVGHYLATVLQWPFVDSDEAIEEKAGKTIAEIFKDDGEEAFRQLEAQTIEELLRASPIILATGGGAFMNGQTRDIIQKRATSIWLDCPPEELFKRIGDCTHRPLIARSSDPLTTLRNLARERDPYYKEADITIDARPIEEKTVAQAICKALNLETQLALLPIYLPDGQHYNILIGPKLLQKVGSYLQQLSSQKFCCVITDTNVAPLYLETLRDSLSKAGIDMHVHQIPPGEHSKSLTRYKEITHDILSLGINRKTPLIALGGGVVGDLTGFVAATLLRGVPFMQIPTTLLAQVDSSVGGKTGIDTTFGKNLLGAFYQPISVISDVSTLKTLPLREIQSGYAEIVKCALIGDQDFFNWCEKNAHKLFNRVPEILTQAVEKACAFKARIVAKDAREHQKNGGRILLNLGHTFAHALEAEMGYDNSLLHGEAVLIGLNLAFALSSNLDLCSQNDYRRVLKHLESLGMRTHIRDLPKAISCNALLAHMQRDKKNDAHNVTFVLPRKIGECCVYRDVPLDILKKVLRHDGAQ